MTELFHPRRARWEDHFVLRDGRIIGASAVGRTTASLLRFNDEERRAERRSLMVRGLYEPPSDATSRRPDDGSDDDRNR